MTKFPKSMGACADLLYTMREKRLAADKIAEELKKQETALINHIIDNLDKESSGAIGKHHKVRVVTKQKPQIKDFEALAKWVKKTGRFDVFQRRLSETAIMDTLAQPRSKGVPGVELFNAVTVSLTKA
ncbi:MAG: hypothetical protein E6Q97_11255 [Desulfurellales bacterium]|nr:MAG: hypothetical protein E6Q97_11255 [Desulfurellales bacterium]